MLVIVTSLELAGSELSVSCVRFVPESARNEQSLNDLNRHLPERPVREGSVRMSPTMLERRYCLCVCIVNFRSSEADINLLVEEVLLNGSLLAETLAREN